MSFTVIIYLYKHLSFCLRSYTITELRKRMLQGLQLHGYSERTQEMYLHAVRHHAEHFNKPPDQMTKEELCGYFLYMKNIKK